MNLRQAAQQALEALEYAQSLDIPHFEEHVNALAALRNALAEPDSDYERGFVDGMNMQTKRSVDKAVNRKPQTTHWEGCEAVHPECRKPEQEPVASLMTNIQSGDQKVVWNDDGFDRALWHETPLYTAPTPRKPLTDEEIVRLMVGEDRVQLLYAKPDAPYFSKFAQGAIRELVESGRAIERAHGIGEQHE